MHYPDDRLPLPSEDSGDLADEPVTGETDDYLVAQEEGVLYVPPTDRVLTESADGVDVAGTDSTDAGELEREDDVQPDEDMPARDDALLADVIEALRASDVVAGDRIRLSVNGSQVIVRGEWSRSTSPTRCSPSSATCRASPMSWTSSGSPGSEASRQRIGE